MKLLKSFNRSGIRTKLTIVMLLMTLLPLCATLLATRISVRKRRPGRRGFRCAGRGRAMTVR